MLSPLALFGSENVHKVLLRDVTQSEGVRENQLVGYGLVAGLARTGDTQQTFFTVQTLANAVTRMGSADRAWRRGRQNVAAVFVTANPPPFARLGMKLDVTVSGVTVERPRATKWNEQDRCLFCARLHSINQWYAAPDVNRKNKHKACFMDELCPGVSRNPVMAW
jgi:hypothetical protein